MSSQAGGALIEGAFTLATCTSTPSPAATQYGQYLPEAKIGRNAYITIINDATGLSPTATNRNYFTVQRLTFFVGGNAGGKPPFSVSEAYKIDSKIDDGLPQSGTVNVLSLTTSSGVLWSLNLASDGATTCFNSTNYSYSTLINNGAGINCALSFEIK